MPQVGLSVPSLCCASGFRPHPTTGLTGILPNGWSDRLPEKRSCRLPQAPPALPPKAPPAPAAEGGAAGRQKGATAGREKGAAAGRQAVATAGAHHPARLLGWQRPKMRRVQHLLLPGLHLRAALQHLWCGMLSMVSLMAVPAFEGNQLSSILVSALLSLRPFSVAPPSFVLVPDMCGTLLSLIQALVAAWSLTCSRDLSVVPHISFVVVREGCAVAFWPLLDVGVC